MSNDTAPHDFGKNRPKAANKPSGKEGEGVIELEGKVTEALPNAVFRVQLDSAKAEGEGQEVLAHLAGKLRIHRIRVLPGDRVIVALTPYDLKRGRITRRL